MRIVKRLLQHGLLPALGLSTSLLAGLARAEPLKRLSFRDRLYDLAVHQDSVWAVGYPGMLLRSKDGGASFTQVSVPVNEALFSIDFNASGLGAIVGRSGTLLLTADHGATWSKSVAKAADKPSDGFEEKAAPAAPVHLFGVDVLENGSIVAVGDFGTVLVSQDRGKTWTQRTFESSVVHREAAAGGALEGLGGVTAEEENEGEEARLVAVSFADDQHGFVVGEFGWVLATEDGGLTWKRQASRSDKLLFSVRARSAKDAIAVGSEGTIIETQDGGATWTPQAVTDSRHLFDVTCSGERCAVSGQEGLVKVRESAGGAFSPLKSEALAPLSAVVFVDVAGPGRAPNEAGKGLVVAGNRGYVLRAKQGASELTRVLGE